MPHDRRTRLHIGLRIYKTGLASLICLVFSHALGGYPFFAVVAALICMKPTLEDSLQVGFNRITGTIIGGFSGMAVLYLMTHIGLGHGDFVYQVIVVIGIMLMIKIMVAIGRAPATVITCVVFTSILLMPITSGVGVIEYSLMRMLDTLLGVVVSLLVNELLPNRHIEELQPPGIMDLCQNHIRQALTEDPSRLAALQDILDDAEAEIELIENLDDEDAIRRADAIEAKAGHAREAPSTAAPGAPADPTNTPRP